MMGPTDEIGDLLSDVSNILLPLTGQCRSHGPMQADEETTGPSISNIKVIQKHTFLFSLEGSLGR
jgi:hypothetical protein